MGSNSIESIVMAEFQGYKKDPDIAVAVAAIKALTCVIKDSTASTMMELEINLRAAADVLKQSYASSADGVSSISLTAGCEVFLRYVTRCFLEFEDFDQCKTQLIARGELFASTSLASRNRIAELGHSFVRDGMVVFIHGSSRVVASLLCKAAATKHFSVIVTEGRVDRSGHAFAALLSKAGIPTRIVADAAIGYFMEQADMVIVGAEGVVENGGVVNMVSESRGR